MAEFKLYGDIMPKSVWDKIDEEWLGFPLGVSFEDVQKFLADNSSDSEHTIRINSAGGFLSEAFFIYDALKNSGKVIHTVNDGACNSAAVIPLLAGVTRKGYQHGECFLHKPIIDSDYFFFKDYLNAADLQKLATELQSEGKRMIDLYVEVTGQSAEVWNALMDAETKVLSNQALTLGLYTEVISQPIPEVADYVMNLWKNTKPIKNRSNMNATIEALNKRVDDLMNKVKNFIKPEVKNYEHKDADGVVLFTTTEKEDDSIAVGDAATPDGTFTLTDGRMVTVADGKVTDVKEAEEEEDLTEEVTNLRAENQELKDQIAELTTKLEGVQNVAAESTKLISDMRALYSNYVPKDRGNAGGHGAGNSYLDGELERLKEKAKNKK